MTNVYLLCYYDHHQDNTYIACTSLFLAQREADRLMANDKKHYSSHEWKPTELADWLYCHETHDDGPRLHIERLPVKSK